MPRVTFSLIIHRLKCFCGRGFCGGTPRHTMRKTQKDIGVLFISGRYEYRYICRRRWYTDPSTPRVPNEYGSENSVIEVKRRETKT